jgi:hypothetical protein
VICRELEGMFREHLPIVYDAPAARCRRNRDAPDFPKA